MMTAKISVRWNGVDYPSMADCAKSNAFSYWTLRTHLEQGYTCDDDLPSCKMCGRPDVVRDFCSRQCKSGYWHTFKSYSQFRVEIFSQIISNRFIEIIMTSWVETLVRRKVVLITGVNKKRVKLVINPLFEAEVKQYLEKFS